MQQQEVTTQKSINGRVAASASRLQPRVKLPTAHRIDFKAIKRASRFERVLAYYGIELVGGRGVQRKALCPFHGDTRPSLNVNLDMKVFNCFACGGGGDIIKFVVKQEHPTEPEGHLIEAAEKLAEICGISINDARREALTNPAKLVATEESLASRVDRAVSIGLSLRPPERPFSALCRHSLAPGRRTLATSSAPSP